MSHGPLESLNDDRPIGDGMPSAANTIGVVALVIGLINIGLWVVGLLGSGQHAVDHAWRSYLFAYLFWLGIPLGCMTFTMISHTTGGGWGVISRRFGEAGTMTLPLLLLFLLPMWFGIRHLFPWGHPGDFVEEKLRSALDHRKAWFNGPVFMIRNIAYLVIFFLFSLAMRNGSLKLDRQDNPVLRRRLRLIAAPGILVYFILITSFAMDFILSRETNWYSTIIGFILAIGQGAAGLSFMVIMVCYFADRRPIRKVLTPQHLNDLGNLLLMLVILWAYTAFAQLLVIWQGNTKEDVGYYTHRGLGLDPNPWRWVALALIIGHFFLPFFLLLMRDLKRKVPRLALIAALLLIMRIVDCLWLTAPSGPHRQDDSGVYWTDITAFLGMGGLWLFTYLLILARHPFLPNNASDQPEILTSENLSHGSHAGHAPEPG